MTDQTKVEITVFLKDDNHRKEFTKKFFKVLPIAFGIFFIILFYRMIAFFWIVPEIPPSIFWGLVFIVGSMALMISILYAVGSGFEKQNEIEKSSRKTRIIFSEDGVTFINGFDCDEIKWNDFTKIKETVDGFYIYPRDKKRFYIPEYSFETKKNIINFRALARLNLGKNAKVK